MYVALDEKKHLAVVWAEGGGRKEGGETEMPRPTMMKLQGLFWDQQSGDSLAFVSRLVDDNHFITLVAPTVRPFLYALSPLLD